MLLSHCHRNHRCRPDHHCKSFWESSTSSPASAVKGQIEKNGDPWWLKWLDWHLVTNGWINVRGDIYQQCQLVVTMKCRNVIFCFFGALTHSATHDISISVWNAKHVLPTCFNISPLQHISKQNCQISPTYLDRIVWIAKYVNGSKVFLIKDAIVILFGSIVVVPLCFCVWVLACLFWHVLVSFGVFTLSVMIFHCLCVCVSLQRAQFLPTRATHCINPFFLFSSSQFWEILIFHLDKY